MDPFRIIWVPVSKIEYDDGSTGYAGNFIDPTASSDLLLVDTPAGSTTVRLLRQNPLVVQVIATDAIPFRVLSELTVPIDGSAGYTLKHAKDNGGVSTTLVLRSLATSCPFGQELRVDLNYRDLALTLVSSTRPYDLGEFAFATHTGSLLDHCLAQRIGPWGTLLHATGPRTSPDSLIIPQPLHVERTSFIQSSGCTVATPAPIVLGGDPASWPRTSDVILSSVVHDGLLYTYCYDGCVYTQPDYNGIRMDGVDVVANASSARILNIDLRRPDPGMVITVHATDAQQGPSATCLSLPAQHASEFGYYCAGAYATLSAANQTVTSTVRDTRVVGSRLLVWFDDVVSTVCTGTCSISLVLAHGARAGALGELPIRWEVLNDRLCVIVAGRSCTRTSDSTRLPTRLYNITDNTVTYLGKPDVWTMRSGVDISGSLLLIWYDATLGEARATSYAFGTSYNEAYSVTLPAHTTTQSLTKTLGGGIVILTDVNRRVPAVCDTLGWVDLAAGTNTIRFRAYCAVAGTYSYRVRVRIRGQWVLAKRANGKACVTKATPYGVDVAFEHDLSQVGGLSAGAPEYLLSMV